MICGDGNLKNVLEKKLLRPVGRERIIFVGIVVR